MFTGILSGIAAKFGGEIVNSMFGSIERTLQAYFNKDVSKEQALADLQKALIGAFRDLEVASADAIKATFATFVDGLKSSRVVQAVWAIVVLAELAVLVAYQVSLVPAVAGIEYAYALVGGLCGLGPIVVQRKLPDLKKLVGK